MINEIEFWGYTIWILGAYAVAFVFTGGKVTDTVPLWQPLAAVAGLFVLVEEDESASW